MTSMSDLSYESPYKPLDPGMPRELAQFSIHPTVRHSLRVTSAASGLSMSLIVEALCRLAFSTNTDQDRFDAIEHIREAAATFAMIDSKQ